MTDDTLDYCICTLRHYDVLTGLLSSGLYCGTQLIVDLVVFVVVAAVVV